MSRTVLFSLLLSVAFTAAVFAAGPVMLNVDISPGQFRSVKVRHLPNDAVMAVRVESNGEIMVAVVDSNGYQRFPSISRPLFLGRVEGRLSFSVSIPATDDYFIVFDNRTGQQAKAVQITVHAARSGRDQLEVADKMLREFERQLHQVFMFDPFLIRVEQCGEPKAFRGESGIVLCSEYVRYSHDILNNKQMTQNALCFSIFHEVGRVLLIKWNHPSSSKQEVCDEFATVLMIMLNQRKRIKELAEYFVKNPKAPEALRKLFQDDCHPFSVKRAREILRWLEDPRLVRGWQRALVPQMQTTLLRRLQQKPTPWTDLKIVEQELAFRGKVFSCLQLQISA